MLIGLGLYVSRVPDSFGSHCCGDAKLEAVCITNSLLQSFKIVRVRCPSFDIFGVAEETELVQLMISKAAY